MPPGTRGELIYITLTWIYIKKHLIMHISTQYECSAINNAYKGLGQPNFKIHHNKTQHIEQLQGVFVQVRK